MTYKAFMIFRNEPAATNSLVFETQAEADAYGKDKVSHWMTPIGHEVRESDETVNYVWNGIKAMPWNRHPIWMTPSGNNAPWELTGELVEMLDALDERPAQVQLDLAYQHGGGFRHQEGFSMNAAGQLVGDAPYPELARAQLRHESIRLYPYGYVAIVQPDGSFVVSRMD